MVGPYVRGAAGSEAEWRGPSSCEQGAAKQPRDRAGGVRREGHSLVVIDAV